VGEAPPRGLNFIEIRSHTFDSSGGKMSFLRCHAIVFASDFHVAPVVVVALSAPTETAEVKSGCGIGILRREVD